jgi:CheY-like chemotaxis protein
MKTILIVDDESSIADALTLLLTDEGYRVVTAADGREGLAKMEAEKPDLALVDIMMPMMDGYEMVHRVRENPELRRKPIIMMTAAPMSVDKRKLNGVPVIPKPFQLQELLKLIRRMIG